MAPHESASNKVSSELPLSPWRHSQPKPSCLANSRRKSPFKWLVLLLERPLRAFCLLVLAALVLSLFATISWAHWKPEVLGRREKGHLLVTSALPKSRRVFEQAQHSFHVGRDKSLGQSARRVGREAEGHLAEFWEQGKEVLDNSLVGIVDQQGSKSNNAPEQERLNVQKQVEDSGMPKEDLDRTTEVNRSIGKLSDTRNSVLTQGQVEGRKELEIYRSDSIAAAKERETGKNGTITISQGEFVQTDVTTSRGGDNLQGPRQEKANSAQGSGNSSTEPQFEMETKDRGSVDGGFADRVARFFGSGDRNRTKELRPTPHPVVSFVREALLAIREKEGSAQPTLEPTLKRLEEATSPGDSKLVRNSKFESAPTPEDSAERSNGTDEVPAKRSSGREVASLSLERGPLLRSGSSLEELRAAMPERRSNPIPDPKFWPGAYYSAGSGKSCDLGDGAWVEDLALEPPATAHCRYSDSERCEWRLDSVPNYQSYRWLPYDCDLPFFNAESFLRQWRNKTLLVVGDSLSRNFFEALLCKLSAAGPVVFRQEESDASGAELFRVESFNTTVGRVAAEFLVLAETSREALGKYNQTAGKDRFLLSLDRLDPTWEALLPRADVLILNSGHWWVSKSKRKAYLKGGQLQQGLESSEAYKIAMRHVKDAVEASGFKGISIFRTFSDAHYHHGDWDTQGSHCNVRRPQETIKLSSKLLRLFETQMEIFRGSSFRMMEITRLSEYRHDGHIGPREDLNGKWDCTHWCAGGVPDTWVDVLQAMLAT